VREREGLLGGSYLSFNFKKYIGIIKSMEIKLLMARKKNTLLFSFRTRKLQCLIKYVYTILIRTIILLLLLLLLLALLPIIQYHCVQSSKYPFCNDIFNIILYNRSICIPDYQ